MATDEKTLVERLIRWYLEPASRALSLDEAIAGAADRVVAAGIPLWRVSTVIPTAHPEVFGVEAVWVRGQGCRSTPMPHAVVQSDAYRSSPVESVMQSRQVMRVRLDDPACEHAFPLLAELARQGATDYVITPLELSSGQVSAFSFASDRPGGFRDDEVEAVLAFVPILALRHELRVANHALESLLGLYLGKNAGRRVLAGAFRRGTGELIQAAIWYSDMRGFAALGDRLPPRELVALLDRYFTAIGTPIEEHGGEILKFMGDAVLAIFPVVGANAQAPCRAALLAAEEASRALQSLNDARVGEAPLGTGIALHLGEVMYGNIGGRERLDFTVIGSSVNEAARVEALCKELERPLLMTAPFVAAVDDRSIVRLGEYALRGVATPHEIFTKPL